MAFACRASRRPAHLITRGQPRALQLPRRLQHGGGGLRTSSGLAPPRSCSSMRVSHHSWRKSVISSPRMLATQTRGDAPGQQEADAHPGWRNEREEFIRRNLHLLAQQAFFFEDETWEVLGMHHEPNSDRVHVEAIPEDAEYIGFPAFKFVFSFDPEVAKVRDEGRYDAFGPNDEEVEARIRQREKAKGLVVSCIGCYAFSKGDGKFFLLAPGVLGENAVPEECDPMFYPPPSPKAT